MSPLLLENSNIRKAKAKRTYSEVLARGRNIKGTINPDIGQLAVFWETPVRSKQLGDLVTTCRRKYVYDSTVRLFCNKFQKGWDVKNAAFARKQHEINILKV